jgi:hypothetical protein
MQRTWIRRAAIGSSLFVLFLTGCAHRVSLDGLREVQETSSLPAHRLAVSDDIVTESDVFEFSVTRGAVQCQISISARCKDNDANCPYPDDRALSLAYPRPRTTGFVLDATRRVAIKFPQQTTRECRAAVNNATLNTVGLVGARWSEAKPNLEAAITQPGLSLTISRIRRPERHMLPGDNVRIAAEYVVGGGSPDQIPYGAQPHTFTDTLSTVESDGHLYIPPLFFPADAAPLGRYIDIGRTFGQQASSARVRIPVWVEGVEYSQQTTVSQLERCLAGRWGAATDAWGAIPQVLRSERERCRRLGVDDLTFSSADDANQFIRYRIEVQQSWIVVLWDGRRLERPFIAGQTVSAGLRRAMREATGRDILPDRPVYATVDPRPELREDPFFARVDGQTMLDRVLIVPGDVIHVSNYRPTTRSSQ